MLCDYDGVFNHKISAEWTILELKIHKVYRTVQPA